VVVDPAADELTGDGEEEAQDNEDVRDKLRKALQRSQFSQHTLQDVRASCVSIMLPASSKTPM